MIAQYAPLVKSIAASLQRRLPANIAGDDLVQDGYLGLMSAILESAKTRTGEHFTSYISLRVRGAMLDGLRKNDHGSRKVRREMQRVERAIHQLGHQLGRAPNESEVAAALSLPLPAYQRLLMDADGYTLLSLEDFDDQDPSRNFIDWCADTNSDPLAALERKAVQCALLLAVSKLSVREELVLTMYYADGISAKEIGTRMAITEGRVSQIHAQAVAKLRAAVIGGGDGRSLLAPRWRTS